MAAAVVVASSADDGLLTASWPDALPPPSTPHVLSVAVGNTHWHWALHTGPEQEFYPTLFWRTSAPSSSSSNTPETTPKLTLNHYVPPEVKDVLFGVHQDSSSTFTAESATAYRIVQRVPAIYVYVISTNPTHASELVALFAGIPSLLYKLPAGDFLAGRKVTYPNMGVDRVANIAAAHFFYPSASAVLVIDGGTALTYTAAVPAAGSLQRQQLHPPQRLGGGIGAGLRMKFRSLFDYTNDLPHITPQQLTETVKECAEKKQPLPLIAISTGKNEDTDTMMARSVMGSVLTETALLLCSVIRGWLDKQNPTANSNKTTTNSKDILPAVVITGGDGEIYEMLLQPKHSHIVETNDANIALLEAGLHEQINDDNNKKAADANDLTAIHKRFRLHRHKYLPHHGIQYVLTSKMTVLANMSDDEYIRFQLIGQRVAVPSPVKKTQVVYGTIYSIIRNDVFDKDFYSVHYDESELIDDLEVTKIYDALLLYVEVGEKFKTTDESRKIRMENKLKDAKEAAAMLEAKSASVKKLLKSRMPKKRAASLPARQPPAAKKRKSLETAKSAEAPKPPPVVMADPQSFLGKRVARYFGGEDDKKLFFGTVNEFVPAGNVVDGVDLWSVIYDDGDSEDWDRSELRDYLQLYERNMAEDPKG